MVETDHEAAIKHETEQLKEELFKLKEKLSSWFNKPNAPEYLKLKSILEKVFANLKDKHK